jgi:hypothetical protein
MDLGYLVGRCVHGTELFISMHSAEFFEPLRNWKLFKTTVLPVVCWTGKTQVTVMQTRRVLAGKDSAKRQGTGWKTGVWFTAKSEFLCLRYVHWGRVDTVNNAPSHSYCLSEKVKLHKIEQTVTWICIKKHIKINFTFVHKSIRQTWVFKLGF